MGLSDFVDGKEIGSCLGDLWSVNWLSVSGNNCSVPFELNTNTPKPCTQSLEMNFQLAYNLTSNMSSPHQYGNHNLLPKTIGDFLSGGFFPYPPSTTLLYPNNYPHPASSTLVSSRLASRKSLNSRYEAALSLDMGSENTRRLRLLRDNELATSNLHTALAQNLTASFPLLTQEREDYSHARGGAQFWSCYTGLLSEFSWACGAFTDFSLLYTRLFWNACTNYYNQDLYTEQDFTVISKLSSHLTLFCAT